MGIITHYSVHLTVSRTSRIRREISHATTTYYLHEYSEIHEYTQQKEFWQLVQEQVIANLVLALNILKEY